MGNNNQSMSPMPPGGAQQLPADSRGRLRRPSTSEPSGPLELPLAAGRYNPDQQHANSKDIFSRGLVENLGSGEGMETEYVRRYRSGSISMQQPPPLSPPAKKKSPAVFKWDKSGKDVYISGSFNNWERKIPLVKSENNFYTILELEEGVHEYKFHVDGEWTHHESQPSKVNDQGTLNNVLRIQNEDLNVSDALAKDSSLTTKSPKLDPLTGSTLYPQDEYNSDIPERRNADKLTGPPVLPPHLLQVILNKDVPAHLEPGLLPEPDYVMLNHLYALSIKDGVMVLSDTSRYKKKYVTTLLYKPIDS